MFTLTRIEYNHSTNKYNCKKLMHYIFYRTIQFSLNKTVYKNNVTPGFVQGNCQFFKAFNSIKTHLP